MILLSNDIVPLSGYRITEQIYSGSKTLVYRAVRKQDQKIVVIKLMRNEYPTIDEIAQFRNQYTITKNLNLQGIVKPLNLENYRNAYALVMEDFSGISLKDWTKRKEKNIVSLGEFFQIAIQIVSILEELHRHRIIHKDIKPANVLINPNTLEIKLIDFSIATLLPREVQFITNPNVLEGTLAYISPEQTGRMNRGIDYRSDFYSLGVTFFELLSGELPFNTNDPMELVHAHIAKQPDKFKIKHSKSTNNEEIPEVLCDIVMKLMSKNAEDRYQSTYGLKYDIEICHQHWKQTGNIPFLKLAVKDISDRFLIPEKLYGRQEEVANLLAAFDRVTQGKTEMVLVAGFSGIGKTAVVNEVHKPIVRQRSYFIQGKFDQFQREIPLSALVQAFSELIRQILIETEAEIQHWKLKILAALGQQAQIINDVIPVLEQIIGKQPKCAELSGNAAQNRFNLLFKRFIQVFLSKEHPLVIFLDDLQWADTTSLKFIQLLMNQNNVENKKSFIANFESQENILIPNFESENLSGDRTQNLEISEGSLLLIGAYRDNEVFQAHPLYFTIKEIEKTGASINHIILQPLNQNNLNDLIADTLFCKQDVAIPLTQMVFAKTKGNPFFAIQFLTSLHKDNIIKFNYNLACWEYNLPQLQILTLTDDVVEFMALQIKKLPKITQDVLKFAACIGNEFDLKTLAIINEKSAVDTASEIWKALYEGLVLPQTEAYKLFQNASSSVDYDSQKSQNLPLNTSLWPRYKFIHDRVQQAAYSLIPQDQKKQIHLRIGQLLLKNISVAEREEKIFQLVNQFNIAVEIITDRTQRDELAEMNLVAGRKAIASTAYIAATKYLSTAIELLANDCWETKYELSIALYETAAEAAYLSGNFQKMEELIQVVLAQAKTLLEKVKVYEIKIQADGAQNKALASVNTSLSFLKLLGVEFPHQPNQLDVQLAMAEITSNLAGKQIQELINLPEMKQPELLAAMRILSSTAPVAYQVAAELFLLICLKQINLSIKYGNSSLSAYAYVVYAVMLCGVLKDFESGYQFGRLALNLLAQSGAKEIKARVMQGFYSLIEIWHKHVKKTLKPLLESYSAGLETGDLEFAAYCLMYYSSFSYWIGKQLTELDGEIENYNHAISQIKQERPLNWSNIYRQIVLNLLHNTENPSSLVGIAYDENIMLPIHLEAKDGVGLLYLYLGKLHLCYLFEQYFLAVENATLAEKYLDGGIGQLVVPIFYFYDSLARLAIYPQISEIEQQQNLEKVAANQEKMNQWAHYAPMNYLHKFYLVEAERHRVVGEYLQAMDDYDQAIAYAKEYEYLNEEALAEELAAKFYLGINKQRIAQTYMTDAYYNYLKWGALAKVEDLQKRYSQLLAQIIQQEKLNIQINDRTTNSIRISHSIASSNETVFSTSISDMLDLASVIKASQAISRKIEMEQLLSALIAVVIENAGASKCAMILNESHRFKLTVAAVGCSSISGSISTDFPAIDLDSSRDVPITLINYVKRTNQIFVSDNVKTANFLLNDSYIVQEEPKSILCIPIISQGNLLGILYLENNLTMAAFTRDRIGIINLLSTQAAISLENAILYKNLEKYSQTLEEKVNQRTQELNDKNQCLQKIIQELHSTQTQLIQSEKMSSLGQMVAGIAHEINNPINFIHGNITHISEYMENLLDLISTYQQECLNPSTLIKQKTENFDLDFMVDDLPKILDSMKLGSSRIRNIILGLRNFSRLDESEMKPVNIHQGIDSTLMLLQHRLKEKSGRSEIEVIKEYGSLPEITCYAGQLNQVFMNILNNAIDALEELFSISHTSLLDQHRNHTENVQPYLTQASLGDTKGKLTQFQRQIRIVTQLTNSNKLMIQISDNGCGMTRQVRQKIFDPFFTTKSVGNGIGLGLSISYQIVVDKHKGQLTCYSVPGKGTDFIIEIPIR
ncbi:MAG: AAA family ATPase [Nostoc sp. GBBB01]|uniref:histidine kinase n=1 Tax=Nostoc punctiforme FACHB-252 TaxID=1357509 RepID=A0ABR8H7F0_NOSPU|nr:ATP-binding sensor histidine kinase [Nostoc punctiforme]MBD2611206.1 AAA family ATPase [Nostoc punctiforme FACHB-252]MBL1199850.1 AAA family ATPase [Nostoc sp. GBBB01]